MAGGLSSVDTQTSVPPSKPVGGAGKRKEVYPWDYGEGMEYLG